MKKYVVEIVEKITYKVSLDAASSEDAENAARRLYDLGSLENGEGDSVSFDVEEKEGEEDEEAESMRIGSARQRQPRLF